MDNVIPCTPPSSPSTPVELDGEVLDGVQPADRNITLMALGSV
jgi:hypothetical protein